MKAWDVGGGLLGPEHGTLASSWIGDEFLGSIRHIIYEINNYNKRLIGVDYW